MNPLRRDVCNLFFILLFHANFFLLIFFSFVFLFFVGDDTIYLIIFMVFFLKDCFYGIGILKNNF